MSRLSDDEGKAKKQDYLPEGWSDDDKMNGLMSMFKLRTVNPHDYDAKLKFWNSAIHESGRKLKNPVVTLKELSNRFKRKDRIPAGLKTVLEDMQK